MAPKVSITPSPHPLNDDFDWPSAPRLGGVLDDAQVEQFERDGYVLVHNALAEHEVEVVRDELDAYEAKMTRWLERQGGTVSISDAKDITFSPHAVTRSDVVQRFSMHPVFARLALDLIGPEVRLYWDQAVYKKPEPDREFPWHQDNGYTFVHPQHYLTCWVPLVAATAENGCPEVAPGVHRQGTLAHHWVEPIGWQCLSDPDRSVVVEAAVGDIVCFSSLTPHRTGANRTDAVRKAYILQYAPDGAEVRSVNESGDGITTPGRQDAPERQYAVATNGQPVLAPA